MPTIAGLMTLLSSKTSASPALLSNGAVAGYQRREGVS